MIVAFAVMQMQCGGGEHDVINLCAGLRKAGHQPLVITSGGELLQELHEEGIPVVLCPLVARSPWKLWANGRRLANILIEHKVDIFNPQGVYPAVSGYFATRRLLRNGRKVPNLVTIPMFSKLKRWYYRLGSFVLNLVADYVIVESECEKARLRNAGMKQPISILYNCAPPNKFIDVPETREQLRGALGWPADRVVFIMPARMSAEKGHEVLIRALAEPILKDLPILCYLAGDGPRLQEVKDLAAQIGVGDRVQFGGFRRDMPQLYKAADVFLLCSHYESLPLSIREGMHAYLPVIATRVGGVPEAVEDGVSGLLVPPGHPAAMAAAMARLAKSPELRADLGRRGHEFSARKFDYDQWVQQTVDLMTAVKDDFGRKHP